MARALFVFAHQDDEMAAVSRIAFELKRGAAVSCVFLTDGGKNVRSEIRNRESTAVLTTLGVVSNEIHFIGTEIPIQDGTLVDHLDVALQRLDDRMRGTELDIIYCL